MRFLRWLRSDAYYQRIFEDQLVRAKLLMARIENAEVPAYEEIDALPKSYAGPRGGQTGVESGQPASGDETLTSRPGGG